MNQKSREEEVSTKDCQLDIPQELMKRVEHHCRERGVPVWEFVFDAISEKLSQAHRERRRKPRL